MPPITSPRRSTFHPVTPLSVRPVPIPGTAKAPSPPANGNGMGFGHGSADTSPGSSAGSFGAVRHPTPYMVALSGWPEPVFVAEARDTWEKRKSRPPSPTGFGFGQLRDGPGQVREVRDGISARLPPLGGHGGQEFRDGVGGDRVAPPDPGPGSGYAGMSRQMSSGMHGDPLAHRSRPPSPASTSFPTSSARGTASPDAPSPSATSTAGSTCDAPSVSSSNANPHNHSASGGHPAGAGAGAGAGAASRPHAGPSAFAAAALAANAARRRQPGSFVDPRYARNAPVLGGTRGVLRVAPAWTNSTSHGNGTHTHAHAHAHASQVHGAQPYPAPVIATTAGRGVARVVPLQAHPSRARAGVLVTPLSLIQRATPEVWPPPGHHHHHNHGHSHSNSHSHSHSHSHSRSHSHSSPAHGSPPHVAAGAAAASPHLVTELYPRDPDSPWMWKAPSPASGAVSGTHSAGPASGAVSGRGSRSASRAHSVGRSSRGATPMQTSSASVSPRPSPPAALKEEIAEEREEREHEHEHEHERDSKDEVPDEKMDVDNH